MNFEQARFNMIEQQVRPWNVLNQGVLELLSIVKREAFVPPAYRAMAFTDMEIPLADGQCMLAPRVEARLLQELGLKRHEKALEIGTGSGFMAALLGHRAQQVVTIESRLELALKAKDNLRHADVMNVEVKHADGVAGDVGRAPWDAILLSGSVAEVPKRLLEQLKVGGRLLAIVGDQPVMQAVRITRSSEQGYQTTVLFDTVAARLEHFPLPVSAFKL
jgi:protein-L-isoaspartate(D-aspartate) O-methyltransferase